MFSGYVSVAYARKNHMVWIEHPGTAATTKEIP
jgi:hypothetical protein